MALSIEQSKQQIRLFLEEMERKRKSAERRREKQRLRNKKHAQQVKQEKEWLEKKRIDSMLSEIKFIKPFKRPSSPPRRPLSP